MFSCMRETEYLTKVFNDFDSGKPGCPKLMFFRKERVTLYDFL